jgi:hypothetical protein
MLEYIFGTVYRIIVTIINCVTGIFRLEFGIIKKRVNLFLGCTLSRASHPRQLGFFFILGIFQLGLQNVNQMHPHQFIKVIQFLFFCFNKLVVYFLW